MNQSELFHRWAAGQVKAETIVGTIHAVPHRLHYGPDQATLALRHNNMVLVSAVNRSGKIPRATINTHRTKLYRACRTAGVEFNHAISIHPVLRRPGYPSAMLATRRHIDDLVAGLTPDSFPIHEAYGYVLSRGSPDQRVLARYLFICRMIGCDPVHDTIEAMAEWHRCISMILP